MTSGARFLKSLNSTTTTTTPPPSSDGAPVDPDFVVILAALLCALICVLGLVAVARCAWLRRLSAPPPANRGLKKKVLNSLPKVPFSPAHHSASDCPICLSDFSPGDPIRVLPHCHHAFHVSCIDTWLGSHSSCPSCRQILALRCHRCGGGVSSSAAPVSTPPPLRADAFLP